MPNLSLYRLGVVATGVTVVGIALYMSYWASTAPSAIILMQQAGYPGVLILGIIAGLNAIVPIPAATFSSPYLAAELSVIGIVICLTIGTFIADSLGYWFGSQFTTSLQTKYHKIATVSTQLAQCRYVILFALISLYAAFVPFPNEALVIPLAIAGISYWRIVPPLVLGGFAHQLILVLGFSSLTQLAA